jgi:hypothetical protein
VPARFGDNEARSIKRPFIPLFGTEVREVTQERRKRAILARGRQPKRATRVRAIAAGGGAGIDARHRTPPVTLALLAANRM